jgi:hypothetical protein
LSSGVSSDELAAGLAASAVGVKSSINPAAATGSGGGGGGGTSRTLADGSVSRSRAVNGDASTDTAPKGPRDAPPGAAAGSALGTGVYTSTFVVGEGLQPRTDFSNNSSSSFLSLKTPHESNSAVGRGSGGGGSLGGEERLGLQGTGINCNSSSGFHVTSLEPLGQTGQGHALRHRRGSSGGGGVSNGPIGVLGHGASMSGGFGGWGRCVGGWVRLCLSLLSHTYIHTISN